MMGLHVCLLVCLHTVRLQSSAMRNEIPILQVKNHDFFPHFIWSAIFFERISGVKKEEDRRQMKIAFAVMYLTYN